DEKDRLLYTTSTSILPMRTRDPFMVLSKHQEAGIKDLMRKSKGFGEAAFILGIKIYRDRSKRWIGLSQNAYMDKILKRYRMDNSKRGYISMQERLDLNKSQGAQTPKEVPKSKTSCLNDNSSAIFESEPLHAI
ncbi:hypothetical protein Tco_0422638, partial [Tanacetum coccineum]